MMYLWMSEVQTELALTDQQKQQIEALRTEADQARQAIRGNRSREDYQNMSEADRQKARDEMRQKMEAIGKQTEEKLGKILTAKQVERLSQLRLQREGVFALTRAEVATALGLTTEQQAQIQKVMEAGRPQGMGRPGQGPPRGQQGQQGPPPGQQGQQGPPPGQQGQQGPPPGQQGQQGPPPGQFGGQPGQPGQGGGDPQAFMQRMRQVFEKMEADVLAVLTDAQKAKLTEMKGAEFQFPEPQFGPGGRQGQGRGQGQDPNGGRRRGSQNN